jgi:hypothetical protein
MNSCGVFVFDIIMILLSILQISYYIFLLLQVLFISMPGSGFTRSHENKFPLMRDML